MENKTIISDLVRSVWVRQQDRENLVEEVYERATGAGVLLTKEEIRTVVNGLDLG